MSEERLVALALVTQTQLAMLGPTLEHVFRIKDSGEQFADLLRALDRPDLAAAFLNEPE